MLHLTDGKIPLTDTGRRQAIGNRILGPDGVPGRGFLPAQNVLNTIKMVPEVCRIFCATANPTEVILAQTEQGRGILGVVDGFSSQGIEDDAGIEWRKGLLRQIGYKLG